MGAPYNKIRSKTARAVAAYLVSVGGDCGGANDIAPANSVLTNDFPFTTVKCTISRPEVPMTGLRRVPVMIVIKGKASTAPGDQSPELALVNFDKRVGATADAMMQSDDGETLRATAEAITTAARALAVSDPTNHSDMEDFTCQAVYDTGEGDAEPEEDGADWREVLMFDLLCSSDNVD